MPGNGRSSPTAAPTFRDIFIGASYHWRLILFVILLAIAAAAAGWVASPTLYTA